MRIDLDFSARGWARVLLWTVIGTIFCVAMALYVDSFNFDGMSDERRGRAILIDVLLPTFLAGPLILFFTMKLRELAITHYRLSVLAATDSLTSVLNRGAFTTLVDAYLTEVKNQERETKGALLVIDADNFKSINDSFGHDRGDEAMRIVAGAIKSVLRGADIVGRIGGDEFGVFLPGSDAAQATLVAERIRRTVSDAIFQPQGSRASLSVSVGGAVFARRLPFSTLFRLADQQLYAAKGSGRNRIAVSPIIDYG